LLGAVIDKQSAFRHAVRTARRSLRAKAAPYWRRALWQVSFIAITGSCGKTTTTALLGAILSEHGRTKIGIINNIDPTIRETLLKTRPWHRWCIHEISGEEPGVMAARSALFRPGVGIVTMIGSDHRANFRNADAIAQEKGTLIGRLPRTGVAILNLDDPRVAAMASRCKGRVVTFGCAAGADLQAFDIAADWPDRLSFKVAWRDTVVAIKTRLVGGFWLTSVLAAIACALDQGIDIDAVAGAVERFEPIFGRNSVHEVAGGPIIICGATKAPEASLRDDIDVIRRARAPRKTLVLGNVSDYSGSSSPRYRKAARDAASGGVRVIGVGPNARAVLKVAGEFAPGQIVAFETCRGAYDFLVADCIAGELILLKGAASSHLERLVLNWDKTNRCWKEHCGLRYCMSCVFLENPTPA
jgi:UDP-N-acetylmuramoyl-tripeptide--D-alanyl-D-alanine ligase